MLILLFFCEINELINKRPPQILQLDSRHSPRRHCSISGFLSQCRDWMDPVPRCDREAQSDAALLESRPGRLELYLMAAVVSCLYTTVLNELDLWPLRLTDHP